MSVKISGNQDADPFKAEKEGRLREVGQHAIWSLSSCKSGFGIEQLRDNSTETFWQSDGPQPHLVNIQFPRKITIEDVCIYMDFKADESYTPNRISIRCGSYFNDLVEVEQIELMEPSGWIVIPLRTINNKLVRTFMVQIAVLCNHQNGRDTHLRQIKIRSPEDANSRNLFSTTDMKQFAVIR